MLIWDRKYKRNLMVFRTQIDKMDRSAKVLCSLSFLIGFWDPKWQNGHMSIWDSNCLANRIAFWTKSAKMDNFWAQKRPKLSLFSILRGQKRQCFSLLLDLWPLCPFWSQKRCSRPLFSCLKSTCAKMEIPASENPYFFLANFNISGTWNSHFCTCRFETVIAWLIASLFGQKMTKCTKVEKLSVACRFW